MPNVKQARDLTHLRRVAVKSRHFDESEEVALCYAQLGLPFVSDHSAFTTVHLRSPDALALKDLQELASRLHRYCAEDNFAWVVVIGWFFFA